MKRYIFYTRNNNVRLLDNLSNNNLGDKIDGDYVI